MDELERELRAYTERPDAMSLRLDWDRDYGMDKRTGWSVHLNGVCVVQFADDPRDVDLRA